MSGNKNKNSFNNLLASKFNDPKRVELMSEDEIFKVMDKDFETLLKQLSANLLGTPGAKYPVYASNMFNNPSTVRYLYEYTKQFKDEIMEDENELLAIRHLIAVGYKDNLSKIYFYQDDDIRSEMLLKAFKIIAKDRIKLAKKLKLSSQDKETKLESAIAIAIFSYLNMDQITKVVTMIDKSPIKNRRKYKIFKDLYGKRFKSAYGALFTVNRQSDFVLFMFNKFSKLKKKKRYKVLFQYATHYKKIKHRCFELESDDFLKKNKKIVKMLGRDDIGFKKAFKTYKKQQSKEYDKRSNTNNFNNNNNNNNKGTSFNKY